MALNQKIVEKIKENADSDKFQAELLGLLSQIEEGKQPKRVIDKIMSNNTNALEL